MTNFDDYLSNLNEASSSGREGMTAIGDQSNTEWQRLKEHLKQMTEGKFLGGKRFEWSPYSAAHPDFVVIGQVAMSLEAGSIVGKSPRNYRIVFGPRPIRATEAWPEEVPVPVERWWLTQEIEAGILYWKVRDSHLRMTTEQFADHAAVHFVEYHNRYADALAPGHF